MACNGGERTGGVGVCWVGGEAVGSTIAVAGVEVGLDGVEGWLDGSTALGIAEFARSDPGVGDGVAGAHALSVATSAATPNHRRATSDLRTGAA